MKLLLIILTMLSFGADAANIHVRNGATGANDGTDWTNAYTQIPAAANITRGDTIYVANGTYTAVTLDKAVSGTTLITIKGATVSDHGSATGWSDTYTVCNGTNAKFDGGLTISTNYWTIDGVCGDGSKNNGTTTGYGFRSRMTSLGVTGGIITFTNGTYLGITISHYEIDGIDCCSDTTATAKNGIHCTVASLPTDCTISGTFSHLYIHDIGGAGLLSGGNTTLQNSYIARNRSTASQHSEGWSYRGGTPIVRWNIFEDVSGTGQFVALYGVTTSAEVYGNVFRVVAGTCGGCTVAEKPVTDNCNIGQQGGAAYITGLKFYNNTIYAMNGNGGIVNSYDCFLSSNYDSKNNLWFAGTDALILDACNGIAGGSADYNIVWGVSWHTGSPFLCPAQPYGTHETLWLASGNPSAATTFASPPSNLLLSSNTISGNSMLGTNLGAPYNVDMNGVTRTNWTIGAYEYPQSGSLLPAPTNLRSRPIWWPFRFPDFFHRASL